MERYKFLTESNGGSPNVSRYGQRMRNAHLTHGAEILPYNPSGVHPNQNNIFAGIFGTSPARGIRNLAAPLFERKAYNGDLPVSLQPKIAKPYPWE
jgi:hypothetical protein